MALQLNVYELKIRDTTGMQSKKIRSQRVQHFLSLLKTEYQDVKIALDFSNPLELLVATILSAQCTDARVNIVTRDLFTKYRSARDYASASIEILEKDIFSTGFYRQKAKNIKACCSILIEKYNGEVPADFDVLHTLPGVGRKTASVVIGNIFGMPAIAVDTHVKRISNLWQVVDSPDPDIIEKQLKEIIPAEDWVISSHLIATHGRKVCDAKKPKCADCLLSEWCPAAM